MNRPEKLHCPLCLSKSTSAYCMVEDRKYFICPTCDLVLIHPSHLPSREEEFERYETHQNDPADIGYIMFLSQLIRPMLGFLSPGARGMDFGSGPVPAISHLLKEARYDVASYDIFYADDPEVLKRKYDFVTASEVAEHLHSAGETLDRIWSCINPGGIFGIMTGMRTRNIVFESWYYVRDPTHVIFFSPRTMEWLADHWKARIIYTKGNVTIYRKGVRPA
ncbi:MAG: class I SAM-dependent methyltransferase [Candidatus Marinimicrobia bacterium]|nr:class I SAM-dependent methyltransferase [Candidatus Neomarinimicrobiota bacterium]